MRVAERTPEKLITNFAEAFAMALDPHTSYLSSENLEDLRIHMQLALEGIGAALSSDNGFTVIEELIPGGGAERSGLLKPKDKIIAVAQEGEKPVNVIDMDLRDIIKMIRGRKGTQVTLTILRQADRTDRFDVTITRDKIDIKEQEAKIAYETRTVNGRQYRFGVIDLPSFYGDEKGNKSCYEDMKILLAEAVRRRVDGIVLDLSRNGGGLLGEAVRVAGLFLGKGGIVATKDNRGQETILANGSAASGSGGDKRNVITFPAENPRALYTGPPRCADEPPECIGQRDRSGCAQRLPSRGDRRVRPYLRQGVCAGTDASALGSGRHESHQGAVLPSRRQVYAEDRRRNGCAAADVVDARRDR